VALAFTCLFSLTRSTHAASITARISRYTPGLSPADRAAFRKAAEAALSTSPECSGDGATYPIVAKLWRGYFHPTDTDGASWYTKRYKETVNGVPFDIAELLQCLHGRHVLGRQDLRRWRV
jgi:hypothetical protein